MKLTVDRDVLVALLSRVVGVCPQKSTLPVLSNCLIEAKDQALHLRGTNLDNSVHTHSRADVAKPGAAAVPARLLFDTAKGLPPGPVTLETRARGANEHLFLEANRVVAQLPTAKPDDFPPFAAADAQLPLQLKGALLLDLIEKTFFAISLDEARSSLIGALVKATADGQLEAASTDGHRLSHFRSKHESGDVGPELGRGIIVPRSALAELRRMVKRDDVVKLGVKLNDLVVACDDTTLATRLIAGTFPNFKKVVPELTGDELLIERDALRSALKRAGIYTAKNGNVTLGVGQDDIEIYAFDVDSGEYTERIPCTHGGAVKRVAFNFRYLLEVLDVIESTDVRVLITDTESPSLWLDPARSEVQFVVMPMQL